MIDPVVIFGWPPPGGKNFQVKQALFLTTPLTFPTFPKNPPRYFPVPPQNRLGVKIVTIFCLEWLREWSDPHSCHARLGWAARGWGKPAQPHTGEDGDVRVTIRNITESKS